SDVVLRLVLTAGSRPLRVGGLRCRGGRLGGDLDGGGRSRGLGRRLGSGLGSGLGGGLCASRAGRRVARLPPAGQPRRQRRLRLLDDALLAVQHLLQVDEGGHQARTTANVTSSCADHWMSASPSVGLRYTFDRPMNRSSPAGTATSRSAMARPSTEPGVTRVTVTSASEPFLTCRTVPSTAATLSPVSLAAW